MNASYGGHARGRRETEGATALHCLMPEGSRQYSRWRCWTMWDSRVSGYDKGQLRTKAKETHSVTAHNEPSWYCRATNAGAISGWIDGLPAVALGTARC
jgi:hypothetical protein